MSDFIKQMEELKQQVDRLTGEIYQKIHREAYDDVSEMLSQRLDLITQLSVFASQQINKSVFAEYLTSIKEHNDELMRKMGSQRDKLKTVLSNCGNLKEYMTF